VKITKQDIERNFPWIEEVQNSTLKEQIYTVWLEVAKDAPYERLEDCAFGPQMNDFTLVEHIRGVTKTALAISGVLSDEHGVAFDRDMLIANCLLHDVSKCVEMARDSSGQVVYTPQGAMLEHAFIGAAVAYKHGLPLELLHVINGHSPHSPVEPQTLEAVIMVLSDLANVDALYFTKGILSPRLRKHK